MTYGYRSVHELLNGTGQGGAGRGGAGVVGREGILNISHYPT